MNHVLVAESDALRRTSLVRDFIAAGFVARSCGTGVEVLKEVLTDPPDVVVLDLPADDLDAGQMICMIRAVSDVSLIVAGDFESEEAKVRLLRVGADDLVEVPISFPHLLARLSAVLRRTRQRTGDEVLSVGGLSVDVRRRRATLDGAVLSLSRREFELLAFLTARPGEVVTRRDLLREVWKQSYGDEQTVHVHLSWLRRKLGETATAPRYLHTVRGVGVKVEWQEPARGPSPAR